MCGMVQGACDMCTRHGAPKDKAYKQLVLSFEGMHEPGVRNSRNFTRCIRGQMMLFGPIPNQKAGKLDGFTHPIGLPEGIRVYR